MKNILVYFSILLLFSHSRLSAQKTWIGAGAGGVQRTNFNTASNWSPSGVPGSADNVTMAISSTATITFSANASVNNLTFTIAGNNRNAVLDLGANTLTINGNSTIDALSGNSNTSIAFGVYNGSGAGIVDFKGNVSLGPTSNNASAYFVGNANSKLIFRGNLTLGDDAIISTTSSYLPGTAEFDGTGTQTITWNNTQNYARFNNVVIGNTNNPTINQITGTYTPDNILGNLTINGSSTLNLGTSFWNRNSNGGSLTLNGTSKIKLGAGSGGQTGSNFPLNFSTLNFNPASTIEYTGTVSQTVYDLPSPGYGNLTLTNNSTKTAGGSLDIRGVLLINSPASFSAGAGLSHSITGNWSNSGTFTASTSTITLNGTAQQTLQGSSVTTFYNLIINNTANDPGGDIILNNIDAAISNSCTFTDGIVNSATSNLLIFNNNATASGASNASFVNVKVRKIGDDAFTFPVGKSNVGYMRCGISAPSSTTDAFTAEYKRNSASALGSITASGLSRVSACEYWILDRTTGSSNVNVTLSWSGISPCNAAAYVTLLSSLAVVHFNGTNWNAYGNNSYTGNGAAGTVTWNNVSSFSPFTLGSTTAVTNPLPVKFSFIKALKISAGNRILWTNLTEENLQRYELERSADGIHFNTIYSALPQKNDGQQQDYSFTDESILAGINFYRVKAVETDGSVFYSVIVNLKNSAISSGDLVIYPNPVATGRFTMVLNDYAKGNYNLRLMNNSGQSILTKNIVSPGGVASFTIDLPRSLASGLYFLQLTSRDLSVETKLLVR